MTLVSVEEARRIALRAQLLDGSATSALDTIRRLGYLQIDPISTVAPPQDPRAARAWGDTPWLEEALGDLAAWIGAERATAAWNSNQNEALSHPDVLDGALLRPQSPQ